MALASVNGAVAVDLPYGRAAFTMTAILPPAGIDVDFFIQSLDQPRWNAIIGALHQTKADVYLPKFTMKWRTRSTAISIDGNGGRVLRRVRRLRECPPSAMSYSSTS